MSAVPLSRLLAGIAPVPRDVLLHDLTLDSRQVRAGGAFLACRGARHHGLEFAAEVARRGAAAILWEPDGVAQPPAFESDIVLAAVPELSRRASELADRFFDLPSRELAVVGVTGTNGKTTCAWLLAQALTAAGQPAAYLGTLGSAFGGELVAGEMTTPDAVTVQRQLAAFRGRGARRVAMEVSSHGLVQARVQAVRFDAAVFTNLTREHLDFHGDMAAYGAAKATLFERGEVRLRVFNVDDAFGAELAARFGAAGRIACSRSRSRAPAAPYLLARDPAYGTGGTSFRLESSFGGAQVATSLLGEFNVDNTLAVLAVLLGSGIGLAEAAAAMRNVRAPSGRLETFTRDGGPTAVVDYAHTPDALDKALQVLRRHCTGRLTVVFGCGGERDRGKRAEMGAIAARRADRVVLTDDNPRGEDAERIIADIAAGLGACRAAVIRERRAAIRHALAGAAAGDVVLVAGKGHEQYQITGTEKRFFSDQQVVREALEQLQRGAAGSGGASGGAPR
ncbi:MAG TPA: UDP-N-acetylmuramoyl-L-alanyl-D-glutamate--2,6-diaminopimelate ligase [Steroidobacteraceae bacterium]|nr:UDP-N-acetylmuramoyl-L-alanyl-D-glutamate--2,6-diaminopimelate ligase [Steroidobacteraceae bacterium]